MGGESQARLVLDKSVLVSEPTMLANQGVVEGSEVDKIELKGVARPVRIYKIEPQT